MLKRRTDVQIDRSVDEVFAILSDVEKTALWHPATVEEYWTSEGEVRVGSTRRAVAKSFGIRSENEAEVTIYEQDRALGLKSIDSPVPFEIAIDLEELSAGTKVSWVISMEPTGAYRWIGSLLMSAFMSQLDSGLEQLKVKMETHQF